ncbi:MAG: efflux RND transporter permease subunit [Rhodospirillales bacterium]|nr:efflux RND transporter permease subunit [Rhodospirillales bacterium]
MNISELCIRRPIMTGLLTVALIGLGVAAYGLLPVAALPRVDFPTISVTAVMPGASPETMASSIAAPLEREFTTIAGTDSITSISGQGTTSITLQFDLDRDIDAAALDVQSAISRASRRMPAEMTTPPAFRKSNPADQPVLLMALSSATVPMFTLNDYAETMISPRISRLTGVAQVLIYGAQKFAVRAQIDPESLANRNIALDEVNKALAAANANTPVGTISGPAQQFTLQANKQLPNAEAFKNLVIAYRNGSPVRLGEVAKVVDSVENNRTASWFNGSRSIVLAVQRQPDANTVEVVDRVRALLPVFKADLPGAVSIDVMNDRSVSIRLAVEDVQITLALTIVLVVMVIFLFLRRVSATLIPTLAMPVSLIATLAGMYVLGYSIDNISLLGLTLAVGLVVDDAIVMLENIVRYIEKGMAPFEAALRGSREIGFTIVSITFSLVAVFIPILLMGGVIGRIFREFAVVVSLSILLSAAVSLTLTPILCSRFLKPERHGAQASAFERGAEAAFLAVLHAYERALDWVLVHKRTTVLALLGTLVGSGFLFAAVPKGFFPIEDTGQMFAISEAAQDISFPAMAEKQRQVAAIVLADPAVRTVTAAAGLSGLSNAVNTGRMFINLKPRAERPPVGEVIQRLRGKLNAVPGINVFLQPVQNLNVGGRTSKSLYQYTIQGIDLDELYDWAGKLEAALRKEAILQDVTSDMQLNAPQLLVDIDRDKASSLGVAIDQVRSTLYSAYGSRQVSTIYTPINDYQVIVEVDPRYQQDAESLSKIYLRANSGKLVPLDAVASVQRLLGPLTVNHQSQMPAVTISFNLTPGASLGQALDRVRAVERSMLLPPTLQTNFSGTAQVFQKALANQGWLLLSAILVIYVVLGVLYESLIHPITILSGLPSAALGGLLALLAMNMELSVIAIIGILMLIGIVKKNAIMMIDFAIDAQRNEGLAPIGAIRQACLLRFRPIMMTTMAALMGTLPIAVGAGASAELRQPLGVVVVGGLLVSQLLTLFITPVLYLYLEQAGAWVRRRRHKGALPRAAE